MSLFDKLKDTKFKSLKFGSDKPGGGTSPEPIIQKPIKDNNLVGVETTVADTAAENRDRISRLIKSTPRGINFLTKQSGLQLSNTRLELPKGNIFGVGVNSATRLTPLTFYNKETLLTQEGGNIGDHFDRFGLTPFMEDSYKYINIATSNNTTKNNRLVGLQNKLETKYYKLTPGASITPSSINTLKSKVKGILGGISTFTNTLAGISNIFGGSPFLNSINNKISGISRLVSPFLSPTVDQYIGGPGSKFGVGTTNIRRFDFTNDLDKFNALKELSDTKSRSSKIEKNYLGDYLRASVLNNSNSPYSQEVKLELPVAEVATNFAKLNKQISNASSVSYNGANVSVSNATVNYSYKTKIQLTIPTQNHGFDRHSKTFDYITNLSNRLDEMYDRNDGENMSVVFQLINPFTAQNLHRIIFPAYINGFKVNSDATWNDVSYIGRSENLYVYSKFKRTVSFNLQIPCFNIIELRERHRALGALESSLAGQYSKDNKLGGILTRLYLGNYLKGETGIINNISYDIPNDSSWDIDEQLAHNINVSINFTVIHNDLPTYRRDGGFFSKTIPNGANYFISSDKALANTGATKDSFNENIPNRFTKIDKDTRKPNNTPLGIFGNPKPPEDANDAIKSNSVASTTNPPPTNKLSNNVRDLAEKNALAEAEAYNTNYVIAPKKITGNFNPITGKFE
jgi:hypothetical protein